jgi:mevalonate kinase
MDLYFGLRSSLKLCELQLPLKSSSIASLDPYLSVENNTKKTGLGSSAALVTSLVGVLLQHFGLISLFEKKHFEDEVSNLFFSFLFFS